AAFREGLALAVKYAKTLGCPRIHLMAGRLPAGTKQAAMALEMEATFIENLRYAADILAQEDMTGLLEPMNSRITDPRYFLTTPHQAAAILEKVGRPNLRLQLDIFHCQIMDGNLTRNLEMYFPLIGHIQVGQVPGRHEPDSPGEVNFPYLFQLLESLGYEGYVGCEYTPQGEWGWNTGTPAHTGVEPGPAQLELSHKSSPGLQCWPVHQPPTIPQELPRPSPPQPLHPSLTKGSGPHRSTCLSASLCSSNGAAL
uniref:Xylose isomerase-like TIM barrel domain-containing protein n=1 Tax=Gopherus agassizii TaxID=38772 RepID=A0A452J1C7_9SAUR